MADEVNALEQSLNNRESGAEAAGLRTQATHRPVVASKPSPATAAAALACQAARGSPGCQQRITMSIFFDGTGNNLDADTPTAEHSNVARLFNAHPDSNEITQVYRRYLPGIGTYFREIGDPGGTTTGRGMGAYGQKRLDWAFKELALILQKAEARAKNPSNKIIDARLAVFGFSRGSASARAFCRELQRSCTGQRSNFKVRAGAMGSSGVALNGGYPIEVYFLGIFDTVASVGTPLSTNNIMTKRRNGVNWRDLLSAGNSYGQAELDLQRLVFGAPGADPAPGSADGHGAWAGDLKVADIVAQCVHMVSAHEMRNSFPLDSALDGMHYPEGTIEMAYPGVHSDVGGGYRHGEGGKSTMLSRVPLRAMLDQAVQAGVPLLSLTAARTENEKRDFAIDAAGSKAYDAMLDLWRKYMSQVSGAQPLGAVVLDHMRVYWKYRITVAKQRINPANAARTGRGQARARQLTAEQQRIKDNEKVFAQTRTPLEKDAASERAAYDIASSRRQGAEEGLQAAKSSSAYDNQVPFWQQQVTQYKVEEVRTYDAWRTAHAKADTAANDSELIANTDSYDAWLLEDAELVYTWHKARPTRRMRPHYKALAEAYEEVVVGQRPMSEQSDTYKFFNLYVHDSLSGFATDNTRPSDPRVIYIGGDVKKDYALRQDRQEAAVQRA